MKGKDLIKCMVGYSLIIGVFLGSISLMEVGVDVKAISVLEDDIKRAAIQCYAVEGFYPPDWSYLKDHYSVPMDEEKYSVYYDIFASNIMPDIQVIKKE